MPPLAQPGVLRLAQRLRGLREQTWPEAGLTQAALAAAFTREGSSVLCHSVVLGKP